MTREGLRSAIAAAIKEATRIGGAPNKPCVIGHFSAATAALSALEAAGVRLAQVKLPARLQYVGAAYLAREGATGVTPEAFAAAFEEVVLDLAASPYAPAQKDETE